MGGTQWRKYKAMMEKEMEAVNIRKPKKVGDVNLGAEMANIGKMDLTPMGGSGNQD